MDRRVAAQPGGTYAAAKTYDSGDLDTFAMAIGDLDGDGLADIAVANSDHGAVAVLLGRSDALSRPRRPTVPAVTPLVRLPLAT